jgi:hypothetical protein
MDEYGVDATVTESVAGGKIVAIGRHLLHRL